MIKNLYLLVFLLLGVVLVCLGQPTKVSVELRKQINSCISSGNAEDLSFYIDDMLDLATYNRNSEIYSKTQATSILNEFFQENQPKSFEMLETWKDKNQIFVVGKYVAINGSEYRLYYAVERMETPKKKSYIYKMDIERTKVHTCKSTSAKQSEK